MIFWIILGALVGAAAAQKRGFSMVGGVIGGALLGLFSPLMFFVSGGRKCEFCKSAIDPSATVCPKCSRDQPEKG